MSRPNSKENDIWISLKEFSLYYDQSVPLLDRIDYSFEKGKIYGIVSPSGAGKSSFFRALAGLHDYYGFITVGELDRLDSKSIAYVFQQTERELNPIRKIKSHFQDIGVDIHTEQFLENLKSMHLDAKLLNQYPFMNSGGQNQRFSWLLHFARNPDILLLDEPVANVDSELKHILQDKIEKFMIDGNHMIMIISHELSWLNQVCDSLLSIEDGKFIPLQDDSSQKSTAITNEKFEDDLLRLEDISFGFSEQALILENFNLKIHQGERIGIMGSSGTGKSTLLNIIHGYYQASNGQLTWGIEETKARTALVGQNSYEEFNPYRTVRDTLKEYQIHFKIEDNQVDFLIEQFNLSHEILSLKPLELSGGQMQRMALIKALLTQPSLLLLDESFSGMDDDLVREISLELIQYCKKEHMAIILVMHREKILQELCPTIINLDKPREED